MEVIFFIVNCLFRIRRDFQDFPGFKIPISFETDPDGCFPSKSRRRLWLLTGFIRIFQSWPRVEMISVEVRRGFRIAHFEITHWRWSFPFLSDPWKCCGGSFRMFQDFSGLLRAGPSMRSFQLKREEASGFLTLNQRIEDDRDGLSDPYGGFFRIFQDRLGLAPRWDDFN